MNRNKVGRAVRCAPGLVARETKERPTTLAAGRGLPALPLGVGLVTARNLTTLKSEANKNGSQWSLGARRVTKSARRTERRLPVGLGLTNFTAARNQHWVRLS